SKVPLITLLATGEVKSEGEIAELTCGLILIVRLKKSSQDWKVTELEWSPLMPEKAMLTLMGIAVAANQQVAREVEQPADWRRRQYPLESTLPSRALAATTPAR